MNSFRKEQDAFLNNRRPGDDEDDQASPYPDAEEQATPGEDGLPQRDAHSARRTSVRRMAALAKSSGQKSREELTGRRSSEKLAKAGEGQAKEVPNTVGYAVQLQ